MHSRSALPPGVRKRLGGTESLLEARFLNRVRLSGLPEPVPQYRIDSKRRYRWDFAWPEYKICVELHGGIWTGGAHVRGGGRARDAEKLNCAMLNGWIQLDFTSDMLENKDVITTIFLAMKLRNNHS